MPIRRIIALSLCFSLLWNSSAWAFPSADIESHSPMSSASASEKMSGEAVNAPLGFFVYSLSTLGKLVALSLVTAGLSMHGQSLPANQPTSLTPGDASRQNQEFRWPPILDQLSRPDLLRALNWVPNSRLVRPLDFVANGIKSLIHGPPMTTSRCYWGVYRSRN